MTNQEYQALCNQHHTLTSDGFGVNMKYADGRFHQEYFRERRRELEQAFQEFSHCLEWLERNQIEGKRIAHYWKDRAQSECRPPDAGYFHIPRGAFILAALNSGLVVRHMDESTDAWISFERKVAP